MIFVFSFNNISIAKNIETIEFLKCDVESIIINNDFIYPVKVNSFSSFTIGKKTKENIYLMKLVIDDKFKFPKKNTINGFAPSFGEKSIIDCYTDVFPDSIAYIYEHARNNDKNISLYFKKNTFFLLDINIVEER